MHKPVLLSQLTDGQQATVLQLDTTNSIRRRLQDIGLVPGTRITRIQSSPLGDPAAFLIRGAIIALRQEDSSQILVARGGREDE